MERCGRTGKGERKKGKNDKFREDRWLRVKKGKRVKETKKKINMNKGVVEVVGNSVWVWTRTW